MRTTLCQHKKLNSQKHTANLRFTLGFTLVELAMVLLIVGLLLGGTLKAMAFVDNAKLNQDIRTLKDLQTAHLLYKDKFGTMPGEDSDKPGRFKTVFTTDSNPTEGFFYDLHRGNLLQTVSPKPNLGTAFKATWGGSSGTNYGLIAGENQICITELDMDLAPLIESKLDDSDRSQGEIEYTLNGSQLCVLIR